jgi:8-oxo-dGTP pyrophosphatase MutT (NUDIX family)
MVDDTILTAVVARLGVLLAPPATRYLPLCVGTTVAGFLDDARAEALRAFPDVFAVDTAAVAMDPALSDCDARTEAMDRVARGLADAGRLTAWRNERYGVGPSFATPPLFLLERAAARYFGVRTYAAHVNGITERDGRTAMWIARRSAHKAIDPGMLDNLVGGGIAAGMTIEDTVVKESFEEAGVAPALARQATRMGEVRICRSQPDGLHRETIFVHDLALPPDFAPASQDGEVAAWQLVSITHAAELAARRNGAAVMTADAALVLVDWLLRNGHVPARTATYAALAALRAGECGFPGG